MLLRSLEFARASNEAKSALMSALARNIYNHNEVIYLQEDDAQQLYLVISGHVRLSYVMEDGSVILYSILSSGEIFGELGIFDGGPQCDMAMAVGRTIIGIIPVKTFRSLCSNLPELRECLALLIARRHRSYIELTRIMSLKRLQARIAQALLRIADGLNACAEYKGRKLLSIGPAVTQSDIGLMSRGARGNINRALKAWEKAGWIVIRNRTIMIADRAALEALSLEENA
jgi:CRP/FNR family transcriptional regulator, cyclic AMP receptor protein